MYRMVDMIDITISQEDDGMYKVVFLHKDYFPFWFIHLKLPIGIKKERVIKCMDEKDYNTILDLIDNVSITSSEYNTIKRRYQDSILHQMKADYDAGWGGNLRWYQYLTEAGGPNAVTLWKNYQARVI